MKTFAAEKCRPFAGNLRVYHLRIAETNDHCRKLAIRLALPQLTFHAFAVEQWQKTALANIRTQHLDCVPPIEVQNDIGIRAFAKTFLRVGSIPGNSFTTGEENGNDGKTNERQFFHDFNKSLARNRFEFIRKRLVILANPVPCSIERESRASNSRCVLFTCNCRSRADRRLRHEWFGVPRLRGPPGGTANKNGAHVSARAVRVLRCSGAL
jgi:hypothetical protein